MMRIGAKYNEEGEVRTPLVRNQDDHPRET